MCDKLIYPLLPPNSFSGKLHEWDSHSKLAPDKWLWWEILQGGTRRRPQVIFWRQSPLWSARRQTSSDEDGGGVWGRVRYHGGYVEINGTEQLPGRFGFNDLSIPCNGLHQLLWASTDDINKTVCLVRDFYYRCTWLSVPLHLIYESLIPMHEVGASMEGTKGAWQHRDTI